MTGAKPQRPNQLLELTLEQVNGAPLNRPTGSILFIGRAGKVIGRFEGTFLDRKVPAAAVLHAQ